MSTIILTYHTMKASLQRCFYPFKMLFGLSCGYLLSLFVIAPNLYAAEGGPLSGAAGTTISDPDFNKVPTFIKSDSLTLKAEERIFLYSGNVEVRHGDLTLTSDQLEGTYSEENKVQKLIATKNVYVTKGDTIKANSERAVYEAASETVVLTENPELQQNGSVLTADAITLFLNENRSQAQGTVRVKLEKQGEGGGKLTDVVSK